MLSTRTEHIPDGGSREVTVVDSIELQLGCRVCTEELLVDAVSLVNVLCSLLGDVQLAAIHLVADHVAQVLQLVHPGQGVITEVHAWENSGLVQKCHAFSLALLRINICREYSGFRKIFKLNIIVRKRVFRKFRRHRTRLVFF